MGLLSELSMYGRFAWGLRDFLARTVSVDEALEFVRGGLERREQNLLHLLERGVFGFTRSPYRRLLEIAGCDLGDVRTLVAAHGLEGALGRLSDAGVYVTFEELKGRVPIVRGGREVPAKPADFDNPLLRRAFRNWSSGSTGPPVPAWLDLDHVAAQTCHWLLAADAHGLRGVATALWRPGLPGVAAVSNLLRRARAGNPPERWFVPLSSGEAGAVKHRLATKGIVVLARAFGSALPRPELVLPQDAVTVARWAANAADAKGAASVDTTVSQALRVCVAAGEAGIALDGVTFEVGGEPSTPAKVRAIREVGARHLPRYASAEAGLMGVGCVRPISEDDHHLLTDVVALVPRRREVPPGGPMDAFCFTSLLPSTPKILLNAETDDSGFVERRECGCPLAALGYDIHIRGIHSFRKLTGEGMSLAGIDAIRILEEALPSQFGGSALDYQLLEEEDEQGFTRLVLLVSPHVPIADESRLVSAFLDELRRGDIAAEHAAAVWSGARTLTVRRAAPTWTQSGKLAPLRVAGRQDAW